MVGGSNPATCYQWEFKKVVASKISLNFTESSSRFCKLNEDGDLSDDNVTACPAGSYCLELAQLEFTDDLKNCRTKCKKVEGNTYNTCKQAESFTSKNCTPSKLLF